MRNKSNLRHRDTVAERHIALSYLMIITTTAALSFWLMDNLFFGIALGHLVAAWMILRCLAKEVYFSSVQRIRSQNSL